MVHNPDWGFNWESQIFFPVLSLIGRLTASHHSSVPCRDASVLQSPLPLDSEKGTYWKFFSEVIIIKKTIIFLPWYSGETSVYYQRWTRGFGVVFWGVGLLWFFPLSFSGSQCFSVCTFLWYFGFGSYELSSSKQMPTVTILKVSLSEHRLCLCI